VITGGWWRTPYLLTYVGLDVRSILFGKIDKGIMGRLAFDTLQGASPDNLVLRNFDTDAAFLGTANRLLVQSHNGRISRQDKCWTPYIKMRFGSGQTIPSLLHGEKFNRRVCPQVNMITFF